MSSFKKRKPKQLLNTVSVTLRCSCRKPKVISSIFTSKPKSRMPRCPPHHQHPLSHYSSSTHTTTSSFSSFMGYSSSTTSSDQHLHQEPNSNYELGIGYSKSTSSTVAVEKESEDPYVDFRESMLQMIVEKEIYSKDELKELFNCFLQLNAPSLHGIIIRVFTEIWNSFFFNVASATTSTAIGRRHDHSHGDRHRHRHLASGIGIPLSANHHNIV